MSSRDNLPGKSRVNTHAVRRGLRGLADLIWPQTSLITGREVPGPGVLEPKYWAKLKFLTGAMCVRCGVPFEIEVEPDQTCAACIAHPPVYNRARAALEYGDVSRDITLALKHRGRRDGLPTLAGWMATAGAELLPEADMLIPVPLHYFRLVRRGFNQSAWLAAAISRRAGIPAYVDILHRRKHTPIQGGMSADARRRNVEGAFNIPGYRRRRINEKRILLIDDVLTTGATVQACARALKSGGAASIDVLTLTRVAGPRSLPI